jgi:tetratricopeptide (TPR) repeat protein
MQHDTRRWILVLLMAASVPALARAQHPAPLDVKDLVGQPVVTTSTAPLRGDNGKLVEKDGLFRVYRVVQALPNRVRIRSGGIDVWVPPSAVVPLEGAEAYFTAELAQKPSDRTRVGLHNKRGLVRSHLGNFTGAVEDFDETIKGDPKNAFAYNNRAWAKQNLGRFDEAIADYDQAIAFDPKLAMAYSNRGLCHHRQRDLEAAIADYDHAIKLDRRSALAHNNRGLARMESGQFDAALEDYEEAIKLDPDLALAYYNRALLRLNCPDESIRDPKLAVASAQRACELTGWKDFSYVNTLAAACADAGDPAAAVRWLDRAIKAAPDDQKPGLEARRDFFRSLAGRDVPSER